MHVAITRIAPLASCVAPMQRPATIRFSTDPKDYPLVYTRWQGIECMNFSSFIYARKAENIAITETLKLPTSSGTIWVTLGISAERPGSKMADRLN